MLLQMIMNACKMQGQIPMNSMLQCANTSVPINFIMITFPEKLSMGIPICVAEKCM